MGGCRCQGSAQSGNENVPRKHLFKLQRTSRTFFSLASAEIYSCLDFRFTSTGAKDDDTPPARLSSALDAIVTSDHEYARYIKCFRLTISQEDAFNAYTLARLFWPAGANSTGMLNTALVLMLKRAKALETFQWDVPVELSPSVYHALHRAQGLRNLLVRSPGLPIQLAITPTYSSTTGFPTASNSSNSGTATLSAIPAASSGSASSQMKRLIKKPKVSDPADAYCLSGFSSLAIVAFLEISNLDGLSNISACLKASSANLRSLTLSLAWELASKARKSNPPTPPPPPPPPAMLDDADMSDDDTDDMAPLDPPPPPPPSQSVSAAEIRRDKLAQETILAKIFDLQAVAAEGKKIEKDLVLSVDSFNSTSSGPIVETEHPILAELSKSLTAVMVAKGRGKKEDMQRALKLMYKAAKELEKFATPGIEPASSGTSSSGTSGATSSSTNSKQLPWPSNPVAANPVTPQQSAALNAVEAALLGYGPDTSLLKKQMTDAPVEEIAAMMKTHETKQAISSTVEPSQGFNDFQKTLLEEAGELAGLNSNTNDQLPLTDINGEEDEMDIDMEHPDESTVDTGPDHEMMDHTEEPESPLASPRKKAKYEIPTIESSVIADQFTKANVISEQSKGNGKAKALDDAPEGDSKDVPISSEDAMQKYIRATHGLQLEEFALYLIPLKASIVGRALDLTVLKRITLLDVGPQVAFWHLVRRLRRSEPRIGFHMIHSDDVSSALLEFLSTSEGVRELYFHKKKKKEPEPETTVKVDIKLICKLALRKHLDTLTHLMLKNESDDSWDADERIVRMISSRGAGLVEFAVSMKIKPLHILLQHLTSFTSLRALHLLHLRTSSTSTNTIFELDAMSFLTDTLIHFPARKLKYIGIADHFAVIESPTEIARRVKAVSEKKRKLHKGKGRAKTKEHAAVSVSSKSGEGAEKARGGGGGGEKIWDSPGVAVEEEDSWDELGVEHQEVKAGECSFKWQTKFWEVNDVKVFEKRIRTGKIV
ncbi:MAG: hypothetical protein Q9191_007030 [Dirinaria sp. TL-2023a]